MELPFYFRLIIVVFLLGKMPTNLFAQDLNDILFKCYIEVGGEENIRKVIGGRGENWSWFNWPSTSSLQKLRPLKEMRSEFLVQMPNKQRVISYDSLERIKDIQVRIDDKISFFSHDYKSIKNFKELEGKPINLSPIVTLFAYHLESKLSMMDNFSSDTAEYYVVRSSSKGLASELFYINKRTFLIEAWQSLDRQNLISYYKNYQPTNLILHPFVTESFNNGVLFFRQRTTSFEFNATTSKEMFNGDDSTINKLLWPKKNVGLKLESDANSLFAFLTSHFQNKRVLIDLWATWCGPCKQEFRNYDSAYYSLLDSMKIETVYLSIDTDRDRWEREFGVYGLKGHHTLANRTMIEDIKRVIFRDGLIRIPRYILVDKAGQIIENDFAKPSHPNFRNFLIAAFK